MMGAVTTFFCIAASVVHTTDTGSDLELYPVNLKAVTRFNLSKEREPKWTCPEVYCIEDLSMYQIYDIQTRNSYFLKIIRGR